MHTHTHEYIDRERERQKVKARDVQRAHIPLVRTQSMR